MTRRSTSRQFSFFIPLYKLNFSLGDCFKNFIIPKYRGQYKTKNYVLRISINTNFFQHPVSNITKRELGDATERYPLVDYTPPSYINLLFTDLGVLTPAAVADELLKMYV